MRVDDRENSYGLNPVSGSGSDQCSISSDLIPIGSSQEGMKVQGRFKAPRFSPRTALATLARYGITGATSYYSSGLLETVALVGAKLAVEVNPLIGHDPKLAVTALAISYIPLVTGTLRNANQAWESLQETGVSVSFLAKVGYDLSKKCTDNNGIQKVATYLGFSLLELTKEIPWYIGAFGGDSLARLANDIPIFGPTIDTAISSVTPTRDNTNEELVYLMGANIFGAGYQYIQSFVVGGALDGIRSRKSIKTRPNEESKK